MNFPVILGVGVSEGLKQFGTPLKVDKLGAQCDPIYSKMGRKLF
jgi:hypothetical protein